MVPSHLAAATIGAAVAAPTVAAALRERANSDIPDSICSRRRSGSGLAGSRLPQLMVALAGHAAAVPTGAAIAAPTLACALRRLVNAEFPDFHLPTAPIRSWTG